MSHRGRRGVQNEKEAVNSRDEQEEEEATRNILQHEHVGDKLMVRLESRFRVPKVVTYVKLILLSFTYLSIGGELGDV